MKPPEADRPLASSAAQNLIEHLQRQRRDHPADPGNPDPDTSTQLEQPQAQRDKRPQADWSAKQRHCSHPATMVKRFDDGVTYCRLCYACLIP